MYITVYRHFYIILILYTTWNWYFHVFFYFSHFLSICSGNIFATNGSMMMKISRNVLLICLCNITHYEHDSFFLKVEFCFWFLNFSEKFFFSLLSPHIWGSEKNLNLILVDVADINHKKIFRKFQEYWTNIFRDITRASQKRLP